MERSVETSVGGATEAEGESQGITPNSTVSSTSRAVSSKAKQDLLCLTDKWYCWPRDELPKKITNARIFTYGYSADVIGPFQAQSNNTITNHSNDFLIALIRDLPQDLPIFFVAHSLGGILVKDVCLLVSTQWCDMEVSEDWH